VRIHTDSRQGAVFQLSVRYVLTLLQCLRTSILRNYTSVLGPNDIFGSRVLNRTLGPEIDEERGERKNYKMRSFVIVPFIKHYLVCITKENEMGIMCSMYGDITHAC
jgi:hypothetical protein